MTMESLDGKKDDIVFSGTLQKITTLADGTIRISFDLQEDVEAYKKLISYIRYYGPICFFPKEKSDSF
jgi:hypothetical protein